MNTKQGIAPVAALVIALLVLGGGGYAVKKGMEKNKEKKEDKSAVVDTTDKATSTPSALHFKLDEQNASGQKGEVTITETGTSTLKVIVNLTGLPAATSAAQAGKPSGVAQPAHIHVGSCPTPGAVKYPLTNVDKGASQTLLSGVTIADLLGSLPLAINVHKSAAEVSVYVACGDITADKATSTERMADDKDKADKVETQKTAIKVTYNSQGFSPKSVTVKKGTAVTFDNKTGKAASIASDPHPTHTAYPEFDQYKTDQRGKDMFTFTFEKVGTWKYHDHLNANMVGTVVVTE